MSTTTKDYWTLTEKQRAALTREEVDAFVPFALMQEGLTGGPMPKLDVEPTPPAPKGSLYFISTGGYPSIDIAFDTEEQAKAFLDLNPKIPTSEWLSSGTVSFLAPLPQSGVVKKPAYTKDEAIASSREFALQKTAKARNDAVKKEYAEEQSKIAKIADGIIADWMQCRDTDASQRRVIEVFREFVELASDPIIARKFLAKRYTDERIREAAEWTGEAIPELATDEAAQ